MFGSSTTTTTPTFGGFAASNTTSNTGGGLFGSGATTSAAPSSFGTSTTGGGLFGSTTNNTTTTAPSFGGGGLFGSSASPASTATSAPLFGAAASTSTAPLFGGNATTSAAPSLFGASNTTISAPPLFGASKPATTTPAPLFGASVTSATPAFGNTLFGKPAATTTNTNTLFGQPQQQAQQPQQGPLLDLNRCIQDTNVPHFIVQPDKITRTVVPANFFYNNPNTSSHESSIRSKKEESNNRSLFDRFTDDKTSLGYSDRGLELPTFLTGATDPSLANNNNNNTPNNMTTTKKRLPDEQQQLSSDRNVLPKKEQGIFSHQNNLTRGFDRRLKNQGNADVPASEIREVGIVAPTPDILQPYSSSAVPRFNNVEQPFEEKTQVRVFGFASENTDAIIKHFSTLGDLDPKDCISEGNWITFTYKTHADALKAIACNGMLIDQTHLVGVTWNIRAKELSTTLFSQEQDLFTNATGFMNMPINQQKEAVMTREPTFVDRIREKLLGW